jgi:hypothetical protein
VDADYGGMAVRRVNCKAQDATGRSGLTLAEAPTLRHATKISQSNFTKSLHLRRKAKMPSNRLGKVQKHIQKKKGRNAALHENSRDTKRLQSAAGRDDKLNRLAAVREKQNRPFRTSGMQCICALRLTML